MKITNEIKTALNVKPLMTDIGRKYNTDLFSVLDGSTVYLQIRLKTGDRDRDRNMARAKMDRDTFNELTAANLNGIMAKLRKMVSDSGTLVDVTMEDGKPVFSNVNVRRHAVAYVSFKYGAFAYVGFYRNEGNTIAQDLKQRSENIEGYLDDETNKFVFI